MRVLFASAELAPLARVGGLAEAASGLIREFRSRTAHHNDTPSDVDIDVILPDYGGARLADEQEWELDVPWWVGGATARSGSHPMLGPITLVHVPGMDRPHPYIDPGGQGWLDNDHRFMSFSAAVAALADRTQPDIVHLNDWHTAAATGFINSPIPVVLTIHTLGYQGIMPAGWLPHFGPRADAFMWYDVASPLAGGIRLADRVIAVSPNYAREIVTPEAGMGLHLVLADKGDRLVGIRNGIDTTLWNPTTDPHLAANYDADNRQGKQDCRQQLMTEAGWDDPASPNQAKVPIAAVVSRLVEQKGMDLLADVARFLPDLPVRLAILGSGSRAIADRLHAVAAANPDWIWFTEDYDEALAHRLFAGSDLFIMPSRFEPCGLAQMQAMAYGSIPVVTDVGGLHDTVIDADADRTEGTGFVSSSVDTAGLIDALHRAVRGLRHAGRRKGIQLRGMTTDWSWREPADLHLGVYRSVLAEAVGGADDEPQEELATPTPGDQGPTATAPLGSTTTPFSDTL